MPVRRHMPLRQHMGGLVSNLRDHECTLLLYRMLILSIASCSSQAETPSTARRLQMGNVVPEMMWVQQAFTQHLQLNDSQGTS